MSRNLINAIRAGNVDQVRMMLEGGADPNWRLPAEADYGAFLDDTTALMVACASPVSNASIVRLLLDHGGDPFLVSAGEVSAVWYASGGGTGHAPSAPELEGLDPDHPMMRWGGGDVDRLRLILDAGGDPNEQAGNGRSCVYEACSVGDSERLRLLMERGAVVDRVRRPAIVVPLFAAAESGNLECVKLLVEAGFPADYESNGNNVLTTVGSRDIAEYFWEQGVRIKSGRFGFDAIDEAIEDDNMGVLRFLLSKADRSTIQQKLLTASGVRMNPRAVRMLVELGADANQLDPDYGSPLHTACWQGDGNGGRENEVVAETIEALIAAGANPNQYARGLHPLHEAAEGDWGSTTATRVLLKHGADINARDGGGKTALMIAAQHGDVGVVRVLLEHGADKGLRDNRRKTALDHALANLRVWEKPKMRFFDKGLRMVFAMINFDTDSIREGALADAKEVIEQLR